MFAVLVAPFLPPANGKGDTPPLPYYLYCLVGIAVMAVGVLYWAAWRILPGWFGYEYVPRKEKLEDGTTVTLVRSWTHMRHLEHRLTEPSQFSRQKIQ